VAVAGIAVHSVSGSAVRDDFANTSLAVVFAGSAAPGLRCTLVRRTAGDCHYSSVASHAIGLENCHSHMTWGLKRRLCRSS
jgi:hypothetical protein